MKLLFRMPENNHMHTHCADSLEGGLSMKNRILRLVYSGAVIAALALATVVQRPWN